MAMASEDWQFTWPCLGASHRKAETFFSVEDDWQKRKFAAALIYAWQWVDGKAVLVTGNFAVPCKGKLRHRFQKVKVDLDNLLLLS